MSVIKKIKYWFSVISPHKGYLNGMFVSSLIGCLLILAQALPKSNIVICLTIFNYNKAIMWAIIDISLSLLYCLCSHINYKCYYKLFKYCTTKLQMDIYDKVSEVSTQGLAKKSVDTILITASDHITTCVKFADYLTYQSCHLIMAVIAILIVCHYNLYIGLIMLCVYGLTGFWHIFLGKKTNFHSESISSSKEKVTLVLYDIFEKKNLIYSYNLHESTKKKYIQNINTLTSNFQFKDRVFSIKSYLTYGLLYVIITAITIWLAKLTNSNQLTLSTYLIISQYLVSIIDQTNSGYALICHLEEAVIPAMKIHSLLSMPNHDFIEYGKNITDALNGELIFNNVSYSLAQNCKSMGDIQLLNTKIKPCSISLFVDSSTEKNQTIFNLLRRTISPSCGTITMDGINIYAFDKITYKHNFNYVLDSPIFYNESIIANLKYSGASEKNIIKICQQLGIHKNITSLPHKYKTNIIKFKNLCDDYLVFMLGIARAILTSSEWIAIYYFPPTLTPDQIFHIKQSLKELKNHHGFLIFDANNAMEDICDQILYVEKDEIR